VWNQQESAVIKSRPITSTTHVTLTLSARFSPARRSVIIFLPSRPWQTWRHIMSQQQKITGTLSQSENNACIHVH